MTEGGGFEGSKQALGEVRKQSTWINEQVGAGKLRLDPEAAEKAAKRCREEAEALQELAFNAQAIERLEGLGDYPDGKALAERFQQKANDPDAGAFALIRQMREELERWRRPSRARRRTTVRPTSRPPRTLSEGCDSDKVHPFRADRIRGSPDAGRISVRHARRWG
ncbi:hypothetical protein [Bounagaea algeriensis]